MSEPDKLDLNAGPKTFPEITQPEKALESYVTDLSD